MVRYQAIEEARTVIAELRSEKKTTKAVCPECGMKTSLDMNYCGKCGAKLPVVEAEDKETSECAAADCAVAEKAETTEGAEIVEVVEAEDVETKAVKVEVVEVKAAEVEGGSCESTEESSCTES